ATGFVYPQPQRRTDAGSRLAGGRAGRRCPCPTLPADGPGQTADRTDRPGVGGRPASGQGTAGGGGGRPARQCRQEAWRAGGPPCDGPLFLGLILAYTTKGSAMTRDEPPPVRHSREKPGNRPGPAGPPKPLDAAWLRQLCLDCGADDAGLVEITRPALDNQRD